MEGNVCERAHNVHVESDLGGAHGQVLMYAP